MLKSKPTKRKFYNKWLYKITLKSPGIAIIRDRNLSDIVSLLDSDTQAYSPYSLVNRARPHKEQIINLINFLDKWPKDTWSKRIEHHNVDFYTNDPVFFSEFSKEFEEFTIQRFEPNSSTLNTLDDNFTILVNKLPHKKYQFKLYLLPHKIELDQEIRQRYLDWVDTQSKIRISNSVKTWFLKTNWNWDRRYVLVEDENTLLMLKLRNPEVFGRVYNYVIADK